MLSAIATLLPHPFQNIAMYFSLKFQQPQQQLTFKTLETVSPASLTVQDNNTTYHCHTSAFLGAFIIPPVLAAMFSPSSIWF